MANTNLGRAKKAKNDEFYTQYSDIESEMNAYVEFNKDVFRDKTILLPCDDPEWSNFTRYFAANFERFGLKKLISTSYAKSAGSKRPPTIFELMSENYDEDKRDEHGKLFELTGDTDGSGIVDPEDIKLTGYLDGDGDFRSEEVTKLRDEADIIITNPPFSRFREFLSWILAGNKQFIIIGNQNAITYKEVFPLIKENKIWLGNGFKGNVGFFSSPYEDTAVSSQHIEGKIRVSGVMWFTNIDLFKRHEKLLLDTMKNNLKHNKKLRKKLENSYGAIEYPKYDNYDALEVPFTECIPSDYEECMGVPITFLDKWNPDQFEIVGADFELADPQALPDGKTGTGRFYVREREREALVLSLGNPKEKMIKSLKSMGVEENQITYYSGIMGVPITFLDKYNPAQFEIVGRDGDLDLSVTYSFFTPPKGEYKKKYKAESNTWRVQNAYFVNNGHAETSYKRLFIRKK